MAQFVKLSKKWVNLDRFGAAEDDGTTVTLHSDLDRGSAGSGKISRGFSGDDARTLRAVLNSFSTNVITNAATPVAEEIEDRG